MANNNTLVGKNYTTPDLVAKVTGRAKYAEDFRADGMLFCKLLLSPMPHARVRRIDASAALAMPVQPVFLFPLIHCAAKHLFQHLEIDAAFAERLGEQRLQAALAGLKTDL